jgi:8-oxo-dGTP diphosphatase
MNKITIKQSDYIPQLSVDCVIFGYDEGSLKVLVAKMIFKGNFYALPGGFVMQEEDIDTAAARILRERTGIDQIYLQQFYTFGNADRNNRSFLTKIAKLNPSITSTSPKDKKTFDWLTKRFVTVGYYALIDISKAMPQKSEMDQSITWYDANALPAMIMDHQHIVHKALSALRNSLDENLLAFKLLPEKFTMKDVQQVYETIYDTSFVRTNFQKKILELNVLERLDKKFTGAANKAPYYYRLIS